MTVFTLPSFPYVFKVIKDELGDTKGFGRNTVVERYRMVKQHDRVDVWQIPSSSLWRSLSTVLPMT